MQARVSVGEATSFDSLKAGWEVSQKQVARKQCPAAAKARLEYLTAGLLGKDFSIRCDFDRPTGSSTPTDWQQCDLGATPGGSTIEQLAE